MLFLEYIPVFELFRLYRRGINVALFRQTLLFLRSGNTLLINETLQTCFKLM